MSKSIDDIFAEFEAWETAHPWRSRLRQARNRVVHWPGAQRQRYQLAKQRVVRGWDETAVWSLDVWLCRTLGQQLTHMAMIAHGWPAGTKWTFDTWVSALREYGDALTVYGETNDLDVEPAVAEGQLAAAQDALRWVADNLTALWD